MWEAVETSPGVYNQTYLDEVDNLITKLGEAGMYTLIDGHQDVISRLTCGEGIPDFYAQEIIDKGTYCIGPTADIFLVPILKKLGVCKSISDYGFRYDAKGRPLVEDCQKNQFFMYYVSPESLTIFRGLFFNEHGLRDKYVKVWSVISERLSKNKYIMGFDPLNEPMMTWTSVQKALKTILATGSFDREQLTPVYDKVFAALKASNPNTILAFEPGQVPDEIGLEIGKST